MDEVMKAKEAWDNAPAHIRMMAGSYVAPVIAALIALDAELDALKKEVRHGQS